MESSTITLWIGPLPREGLVLLLLIASFTAIPVLNANSVDPDQMLHSVAFDFGLHCLQRSHLLDDRHKLVNVLDYTNMHASLCSFISL